MLDNTTLPPNLVSVIGSENRDFIVKAGRARPLKQSLPSIFFAIFWLAFSSIFVFAFLGPLFWGEEVHFEANGVPTVASPDNLGPIVGPAIMIGIFVLIGFGMLFGGIFSSLKQGGYFVGTPTRLIHFQNGNIQSFDWEQFSGTIEVSGHAQKGNITLELRTSRKKNLHHDSVYMAKIDNLFEVEQICRKRIKENDPTPTAASI